MKSDLKSIIKKLKDNIAGQEKEIFLTLSHMNGEYQVSGNKEGLTYLALKALEIADKQKVGDHLHFDTTGVVDEMDMPMIIIYRDSF